MSSLYTYADVLLPQKIDQPYTYLVPAGMPVEEESFVEVPLRQQTVTGVVWQLHSSLPATSFQIKPIVAVHDLPPMPKDLKGLIDFTANYTLANKGNVLKMAISVPELFESLAVREGVRAHPDCEHRKLTDKRKAVLAVVEKSEQPLTVSELSIMVEVSTATVRAMLKDGELVLVPIPEKALSWTYQHIALSDEQQTAADAICAAEGYKTFLLDGVTGSGKTEVYFEAIAKALASGRQSLVLLPEIALSSQSIDRFTKRFGAPPVVWHSDITVAQKRKCWRQIASGEAKVVIGARSALFLPFSNLGLIIVDEEHETSYKQEEGVIYNARDMAVVRAHLGGFPIVLVSATPSLETLENAVTGRYQWLKLRNRHAAANLPDIHLIDMRGQVSVPGQPKRWISPLLEHAMRDAIERGEQALIYLNRRGYAPLVLCSTCGERIGCPNCTAYLVEHKKQDYLMCHHCGYVQRKPNACSKCGEAGLVSCGPGVERVAEELLKLFPQNRIAIMSSDILTSVQKLEAMLEDLHAGKIDIIVGTQMIAKGHHFPKITVVGVVDADLGLAGSDLRAGERTYQLLSQVSGRAGREQLPGHVYLQTYLPNHPVMQALVTGKRDDFIAIETEGRKLNALPPYGRLAALIISSRDKALVEKQVRQLARVMPNVEGIQILGPAPAALATVRNWHRWRFLIRAPKDVRLQPLIRSWTSSVAWPVQLKLQVDLDPYNFL